MNKFVTIYFVKSRAVVSSLSSPLKMISKVAFEQISGNYGYGAYGPFRVIMMKDTGYINVTKMCTSGGKDFKDWSRLKGSHQLIEALKNRWHWKIHLQILSIQILH